MSKRKIDKVSAVMIAVFVVVIAAAVICVGFLAKDKLGVSNVSDTSDTEQVSEVLDKENEGYKFENFMDLSDKFLEACKNADVNEMYNLYYEGFLDGMRLNMQEAPSKEEFDEGLKENMLKVTGFDEYQYGCAELPPTQSPGSYAAYIYSMVNNGKEMPLSVSEIEDCVNLVVYLENAYKTNHFMAKIDGYWYFIV